MSTSASPKPKSGPTLLHPALSRTVLWILVLGAGFWVLEHIKTTLTVFGLAFLIAYLLNSIVMVLQARHGVPRGRAILLVYGVLVFTASIGTALVVPMVVGQVNAMVGHIPSLSERITGLANGVQENYISRMPEQYREQLEESLAGSAHSATEAAKSMLVHMRDFVLGLISATFLFITSTIVSIYVILRWNHLGEGLLEVLPENYRHEVRNLGNDLNKIFGGYVKAQITLAATCGILTLLFLFLHSLVAGPNPYILLIACVATLTLPIPVLNQVVPPITAIILGMIQTGDVGYAAQLAAVVYLVNIIVERTLAPRIMSEAVGVSALFVLFAAFSGAELLGPVGALLGVPLAAMVKSIFVWFHGRFLIAGEEPHPPESPEISPDILQRLADLEARVAQWEPLSTVSNPEEDPPLGNS